jgi:hypothetical protein
MTRHDDRDGHETAGPLRRIGHTVKVALFGTTRPIRAITTALRRPAEAIDPARADPRAVMPADPPEETVDDRRREE